MENYTSTKSSSETNIEDMVVTSDHIRQVINSDLESYDFLLGHHKTSNGESNGDNSVLCDLKEDVAPPMKKKRKKTNSPNLTKIQKSNQSETKDKLDVDDMERKKVSTSALSTSSSSKSWIPTKHGDLGMLAENKVLQKTVAEAISSRIPEKGLLEDTDEYD